jgi:hypothetical protein
MKQELISRCQLCERLIDFGWLPSDPVLDLGEDFIAHIYIDDEATGVLFHIQEKSTRDLHGHQSKDGRSLVYRFPVKDLKHWESLDFPVVLLVWDVTLREGRWVLAKRATDELDRCRPLWRDNKAKASVHLPWQNTTDDDGLLMLRQEIGLAFYPIIAKDEPTEIEISLDFSDPKTGNRDRAAFDRFVKEGEKATFIGHTVRSMEFSGWFGKWFGYYDPDKVTLSVESGISQKTTTVGISLIGDSGEVVSLSGIELKANKLGTELLQLTNEHQVYPIHFILPLRDPKKYKEGVVTFTLKNLGHNPCESVRVLSFFDTLSVGGTLTVTFLEFDGALQEIRIPPGQFKAPNQGLVRLCNWLCDLQGKIGRVISIPEEWTEEDIHTFSQLTRLFADGQIAERHSRTKLKCDRRILDVALECKQHNRPLGVRLSGKDITIKLFGVDIQVGRIEKVINGTIEVGIDELEKAIQTLSPGESYELALTDVEITETYPDLVDQR